MASAVSMDRDGARAGSNGLSLHSALLADLSYASINTRIRLIFDKGKVISEEPASTVFFLGGG